MPFCRKCGRRLVEYSEVCTDCGQSTTAPIVNTKRVQSSRSFHTGTDKKIAKVIIPDVSPVQIKVITDHPVKSVAAPKVESPVKAIAAPKVAVAVKTVTPAKVATAKPVEPPKPVLSAKHIVKAKKATQTKPVAAFTIAHARPVAGLNPIPIPITPPPKQRHHPKPVPTPQVAQPKPVIQPKPATPPTPVVQPLPVIQITPFAVTVEPPPQPKPVAAPAKSTALTKPVTPAPVYPPHEIIQSKVSIKEDILAHPQDYETEAFEFDLKCPNKHFWPEGSSLPVSKGKAYCPKCGERLSKPKPRKQRSYRRRSYFH